jgi:hypothetical protein
VGKLSAEWLREFSANFMISVAERKRNAEKRIQRKKKRGEIEIN